MSKCKDCGFLAVWLRTERRFDEASEQLRNSGCPEATTNNSNVFQAKCFIQKYDLVTEIDRNPKSVLARVFGYSSAVLEVVDDERTCDGHIPWVQGFHPKEHTEMLLNQEALERQRRSANRSLMVATLAAFVSVLGVLAGAFINSKSAHLGAEATIHAAKLQIEAQKETSKQAQPINVTVQIPDIKQPIAEQPIPPKTKHGRKLPQP